MPTFKVAEASNDHVQLQEEVGYKGGLTKSKLDLKIVALLLLALLFLTVGVVLIAVATLRSCTRADAGRQEEANACDYSHEAKRVKLGEFLRKVQKEYYVAFPEEIAWHPESTSDVIRNVYQVHNPSPSNLKRITMLASSLLKEAYELNPNLTRLKPREHKAYLQVKHFLEFTFGNQYLNYTSGIWLLGPSGFCAEPMCQLGFGIYNAISSMVPGTEADIEHILRHLKDVNDTVLSYIDVLKMGIEKGMVRTQVECTAGVDAMKEKYKSISLNGAKGIHSEWFVKNMKEPAFYRNISDALNMKWKATYGMNVSQFISDALEKYVGESISALLVYLEKDHYFWCRPNDVGPGGLSALPIAVKYYNGSVVNGSATDPTLPLCVEGNCRLNGSLAYHSILGYFTTKEIHPEEIHNLGKSQLELLYPQVLDIAMSITGAKDVSKAVELFRKRLDDLSLSYFHDKPLPENETSGEAFVKCVDEQSAKQYCPTRWAAMMKWFDFANMAMSMLDPILVNFFYFTGDVKSTPSCPIRLVPDFNPSSGAQSYSSSDANCSSPCKYNIPFFLEQLGPVFSEYSVTAHEARPGHHTQFQGWIEHFRDSCGGAESWIDAMTYYTAFTEGWALYAENPLVAQDTNIYDGNLMQKYGMLRWQIWRALRLIVDTGMHYLGMTRAEAVEYFAKYAWDETDLSQKEITRYQSNYGQATAYMIGQLDIWALRNKTKTVLGDAFDLKEFHLQALSQGSSPLAYLHSYMNKYVDCKKNDKLEFCDLVLNPTLSSKTKVPAFGNSDFKWPERTHYV